MAMKKQIEKLSGVPVSHQRLHREVDYVEMQDHETDGKEKLVHDYGFWWMQNGPMRVYMTLGQSTEVGHKLAHQKHALAAGAGSSCPVRTKSQLPSVMLSTVTVGLDLRLGLPKVLLSDLFTGSSLTCTEVQIDCGVIVVKKFDSMDAQYVKQANTSRNLAVVLASHPNLVYDTLSVCSMCHDGESQHGQSHDDECRGVAVTIQTPLATLKNHIRKMGRHCTSEPGQLACAAINTYIEAHAIHLAEAPCSKTGTMAEQAFEDWLSANPATKSKLLETTVLSSFALDISASLCFVPDSVRLESSDLRAIPATKATVSLAGLDVMLSLSDLEVLSTVSAGVGTGSAWMGQQLLPADWPDARDRYKVDGQVDVTEAVPDKRLSSLSSLELSLSSPQQLDSSIGDTATGRGGIDDGALQFSFTISRTQKPVLAVCAALRLDRCQSWANYGRFDVEGATYLHVVCDAVDVGHWEPIVEPWSEHAVQLPVSVCSSAPPSLKLCACRCCVPLPSGCREHVGISCRHSGVPSSEPDVLDRPRRTGAHPSDRGAGDNRTAYSCHSENGLQLCFRLLLSV